MANLAPVAVTNTAQNVVTALTLTAGSTYLVQNVGGHQVSYAIAATDPTGENIGWHVLATMASILVTVTDGEGFWVRTDSVRGESRLAVSEA